jgi:hypothetical protein
MGKFNRNTDSLGPIGEERECELDAALRTSTAYSDRAYPACLTEYCDSRIRHFAKPVPVNFRALTRKAATVDGPFAGLSSIPFMERPGRRWIQCVHAGNC